MLSDAIRSAARRAYHASLSLFCGHLTAARRQDMEHTFVDATRERASSVAVCTLAAAEIWNLAAQRLRRGSPQITVPGAASAAAGRSGHVAGLGTDVRHALRSFRARPAESGLVLVLLAFGLATASTIFGVANAIVFQPVTFARPDRLVQIWGVVQKGFTVPALPLELANPWLERKDLFASGGIDRQLSALVAGHGEPELVQADLVSPGLFELLGARPALGRTFLPTEGQTGTDRVVILSDDVWRARFGGDASAIGQTLAINGTDFTVVGVMDATFRFPSERQRLWMPISLTAPPVGAPPYVGFTARLRDGVSVSAATAAVEAAGPELAKLAKRPWRNGATLFSMAAMKIDSTVTRSLILLFGATALLVLMVGLNVANIGMARVFGRARDAAIRTALGASRSRLLRAAFVEQLIVGLLSLSIAVPLTIAGLRIAQALIPARLTFSSLHPIGFDARVFALLAVLALITPIVAGVAPALVGSGHGILDALKVEGRSTVGSRRSRWLRDGLVVGEVACAVVLLVAGALLAHSFLRLQRVDVGFDSHNLVSVTVQFPYAAFPTALSRDLYTDRVVDAIAHGPGVLSATPASGVPPVNGGINFGAIGVEGNANAHPDPVVSAYDVRPEFFAMLKIPLKSGTLFASGDDPHRVVVSDTLAALLWPNSDAVGRRFHWTTDANEWYTVVGVVPVVREDFDLTHALPQIFLPLQRAEATPPPAAPRGPSANPISGQILIAARVSDPLIALPAIRRALKAENSAVVIQAADLVEDQLSRRLDAPRFLLALMLVFAAAGLVLTAAGVYGVLSCLVTQRLREIGVRLMLGAQPQTIGRDVVRGGVLTVAAGLAIGLVAAAAVSRVMSSLLFDVNTHDVVSYVVVVGAMLAVGILASWWPARRAMRADPLALLRGD
jgi:predicted permease